MVAEGDEVPADEQVVAEGDEVPAHEQVVAEGDEVPAHDENEVSLDEELASYILLEELMVAVNNKDKDDVRKAMHSSINGCLLLSL